MAPGGEKPHPSQRQAWVVHPADAWRKIAAWKWDYNHVRPHSALGYRTPIEFAAACKAGFEADAVGQGASNAGPFPHTPIPAVPATDTGVWGEQKPEKLSLSLD